MLQYNNHYNVTDLILWQLQVYHSEIKSKKKRKINIKSWSYSGC